MNKRYKIKKWFKDHFTKDKLMPWVLTGIIMLLVLLCVYFENQDKKNMENKQSEISLCDTEANLNTSWAINQDGNLVGNNLLNPNFNYNNYGITAVTDNQKIILNGTATDNVFIDNNPNTIYLTSGTYYFSVQNEYNYNYNYILIALQYPGTSDRIYANDNQPFTINSNTTFELFIRIQNGTTLNNCNFNIMLNEGSTALDWEPYGVWYSGTNYTQYGTNEYIKGLADNENQYYYFDNRSIKYYTSNTNELIATQNLTQNTYNNYSIDSINYVEQYIIDNGGNNYYGIIDNLNILSKEFFVNINYSSPVYQGYVTIHYSNDTTYSVEPYDYNQNYYIYNGAEINSDLFISKIEIGFHYDDATAIIINTSPNVVLYQNGYNEGYKIGYNESSETFYQNGRKNGYNEGYQIGLNEGAQKDLYNNGMRTLFDSILSYPVNMLSSVFNFEFMGINIASTIFFLISCGIVLWIIKRLWK